MQIIDNAGPALLCIEAQNRAFRDAENQTTKRQRALFYACLDSYAARLLDGIARASSTGWRIFYPATIPGFASRCDAIFNIGVGGYNHAMLNDWLYSRDLRHVLHAEHGGVIRW